MKYIISLFIIVCIYFFIGNVVATSNMIPEDAIRIRVIANSNSDYDQKMKYKVKNEVQYEMFSLLKDVKGSKKAKRIIKSNIGDLENNINKLLLKEKYNMDFNVNYGKNYFPKKEYKGITYKEGYYESLVITLGEGKGDNWWCVLFPPLCLIEGESSKDVEYTTFVKELIDKYL